MTTNPTSTHPTSNRTPAATIPATYALEGGGFGVYRPFPLPSLPMLDPFLLLDEMEPAHHTPGEFKGAPDHPHRGFETVTYMLEGEIEHRDSNGGHGVITPGGVQWMTAGDGIVHSEMPSRRLQTEGGTVHGFQLWVNLPRDKKRTAPRYQGVAADQLGRATGPGWQVRVISGRLLGAAGPADTHTPVTVAHLTLDPDCEVQLELGADQAVGLYNFGGSATSGNVELPYRHLAVFEPGPAAISLTATPGDKLEVLVLAGRPLGEPVARYGPFVMNTEAEIHEAVRDFQAGRMGTIPAGADT